MDLTSLLFGSASSTQTRAVSSASAHARAHDSSQKRRAVAERRSSASPDAAGDEASRRGSAAAETTDYVFCRVVLTRERNSFVALPEALTRLLDDDIRSAAVHITWDGLRARSRSGTTRAARRAARGHTGPVACRCYAAWNGVSSAGRHADAVIEVPDGVAECVGLRDVAVVRAAVVTRCPVVRRIEVEPLTNDDWEVVEARAAAVESELLQQMSVVYSGQVFPLWVGGTTLVKFRVVTGSGPSGSGGGRTGPAGTGAAAGTGGDSDSDTGGGGDAASQDDDEGRGVVADGVECGRLVADSEVVVAPKAHAVIRSVEEAAAAEDARALRTSRRVRVSVRVAPPPVPDEPFLSDALNARAAVGGDAGAATPGALAALARHSDAVRLHGGEHVLVHPSTLLHLVGSGADAAAVAGRSTTAAGISDTMELLRQTVFASLAVERSQPPPGDEDQDAIADALAGAAAGTAASQTGTALANSAAGGGSDAALSAMSGADGDSGAAAVVHGDDISPQAVVSVRAAWRVPLGHVELPGSLRQRLSVPLLSHVQLHTVPEPSVPDDWLFEESESDSDDASRDAPLSGPGAADGDADSDAGDDSGSVSSDDSYNAQFSVMELGLRQVLWRDDRAGSLGAGATNGGAAASAAAGDGAASAAVAGAATGPVVDGESEPAGAEAVPARLRRYELDEAAVAASFVAWARAHPKVPLCHGGVVTVPLALAEDGHAIAHDALPGKMPSAGGPAASDALWCPFDDDRAAAGADAGASAHSEKHGDNGHVTPTPPVTTAAPAAVDLLVSLPHASAGVLVTARSVVRASAAGEAASVAAADAASVHCVRYCVARQFSPAARLTVRRAVALPWRRDPLWEGPAPSHMAGYSDQRRRLWYECAGAITLSASLVRARLGMPPPIGVVLAGPTGSGKTELARVMARALRVTHHGGGSRDSDSGGSRRGSVATVWLSCARLQGLRMTQLCARLRAAVRQAVVSAPTLLVLDDLDAIAPAVSGDDAAGGAADMAGQALQIADLLCDDLAAAAANAARRTQVAADMLRDLAAQRGSHAASTVPTAGHTSAGAGARARSYAQDKGADAAAAIASDAIAAAAVADGVFVVATVADAAKLHDSLKRPGLLHTTVTLPRPNAGARAQILKAIVAREHGAGGASDAEVDVGHGTHDSDAIDWAAVSARCEAYSAADLHTLVSRAADAARERAFRTNAREQMRAALADGGGMAAAATGSDAHGPAVGITGTDVRTALEGFTPAALRGVELFTSDVTWSQVGGLDETRAALRAMLEVPMRWAPLFRTAPIRLPSGVLLYGPPGCGKTLLARAVANECGLRFISVKGPEVLDKYIGASEAAIRDTFARAAAAAPSILFFDEFDAIAPKRGSGGTGVTDRVVNQLLTFLDGVEEDVRKGVFVMAASSRPDLIDAALLRPGRLDRSLLCGFPTPRERADILHAVARPMRLAPQVRAALPAVAACDACTNFSGADLQAILYTAQLEAVHSTLDGKAPTQDALGAGVEGDRTDGGAAGGDAGDDAASEASAASTELGDIGTGGERMTADGGADGGADAGDAHADANNGSSNEGGGSGPLVELHHLETALASARPSLSPAQRRKYEVIYERFMSGRDGGRSSGSGGRGSGYGGRGRGARAGAGAGTAGIGPTVDGLDSDPTHQRVALA